jgi:hypothetical protein
MISIDLHVTGQQLIMYSYTFRHVIEKTLQHSGALHYLFTDFNTAYGLHTKQVLWNILPEFVSPRN